MPSYQIAIITPEGKLFDDKVESVMAPGQEGAFGVLYQHAPFITVLKKGIVTLIKEGKEIFFVISSGIFEVDNQSRVLLLAAHGAQAPNLNEAKTLLDNIKND